MDFLSNLWIPILASAAAVWIASAIIWMVLPHHNKDRVGLPDEDGMTKNFEGLQPGNYMFPHAADRKACRDPEYQKKWEKGPAGMLSIWPKVNMGKNMALTFLTYLMVSVLIAYVASTVLSPGTDKLRVFQVTGTMGVLAYAFSHIPNSIWYCSYPRTIVANILDGVAFGLITGAVFALFWPAAATVTLPGMQG